MTSKEYAAVGLGMSMTAHVLPFALKATPVQLDRQTRRAYGDYMPGSNARDARNELWQAGIATPPTDARMLVQRPSESDSSADPDEILLDLRGGWRLP